MTLKEEIALVLKQPGEPWSEPNLLFQPDEDDNPPISQMPSQHSLAVVDEHYWLAAGEEAPGEEGNFFLGLWTLLEWWVPVLGIAAFVIYCLVWGR